MHPQLVYKVNIKYKTILKFQLLSFNCGIESTSLTESSRTHGWSVSCDEPVMIEVKYILLHLDGFLNLPSDKFLIFRGNYGLTL